MKNNVTLAAIASLLMCAACADQPAKSATLAGQAQQFSSLQWDEISAADHTAHVTNDRLIMAR